MQRFLDKDMALLKGVCLQKVYFKRTETL